MAISYVLPYCAGLLVLLWGQVIIYLTMGNLWGKLGIRRGRRPGEYHSAILGMIEGLLYFGSFVYGEPEFIAVWLGIKTVIAWRHWEYDIPLRIRIGIRFLKKPRWILGRNAYNLFLVGNGLVVAFAAIAWKVFALTRSESLPRLYAILPLVLLGSVALVWLSCKVPANRALPESDPRVSKKPKT